MKRMMKKIIQKICCIEPEIIVTNIPKIESELLKNKVAIVSGGTGGIGMEIAEKFSEAGAIVIALGTNEEKINAINSRKVNICAKSWDLLDFDLYDDKIEEIISEYGNIDILVNCAGVLTDSCKRGDFFGINENDWDVTININLKAVFFLSQKIAKHMIDSNTKGNILNIVSETGHRAAIVPYRISKWGERGFTEGLAKELAPYGIVVNGISPGAVATDMMGKKEGDSLYHSSHPNKRFAKPEEIANLAIFLVSDFGNNIVGDIILSDGGGHLY